MQTIILAVHILAALFIMVLILLQHGKGADMGAAFGSGSANTVFGSAGPAPFLLKITLFLAAVFFASSIGLSYFAAHNKQVMRLNVPTKSASVLLQGKKPVSQK